MHSVKSRAFELCIVKLPIYKGPYALNLKISKYLYRKINIYSCVNKGRLPKRKLCIKQFLFFNLKNKKLWSILNTALVAVN